MTMRAFHDISLLSHAMGATAHFLVFLLGISLYRRKTVNGYLPVASFLTIALHILYSHPLFSSLVTPKTIIPFETSRYASWTIFAFFQAAQESSKKITPRIFYFFLVTLVAAALNAFYQTTQSLPEESWLKSNEIAWNNLIMAIFSMVAIEQLYRNAHSKKHVRIICLGIASAIAFDIYLYASMLLTDNLNREVFNARGLIGAFSGILIASGLYLKSKHHEKKLRISVSRPIVFYSTSLLMAGTFTALMSAGGYYIKQYGGQWGTLFQTTFLFLAAIMLIGIFGSHVFRNHVSVVINKHFFQHKYDYRMEWLKLISHLSEVNEEPFENRALRAVCETFRTPGACLWRDNQNGIFTAVATQNMALPETLLEENENSFFCQILIRHEWVFLVEAEPGKDLGKYNHALPAWAKMIEQLWLIIPLKIENRLYGFILLSKPSNAGKLTWEDIDLLKTVGRQVASYLSRHEAAQWLAQSKQFETYHKLTAFIMHDLKNLIAQQALVVENANKHRKNPEFIEDAIITIENSVKKMSDLLNKLQTRHPSNKSVVDIREVLNDSIKKCRDKQPFPSLQTSQSAMMVSTDRDHLEMIFIHVIRNAQEATPITGFVKVTAYQASNSAIVEIQDDGEGMDEVFLRNRLFQPFDTTKSGKGMGIGAYQTREFIRSMGGDVCVRSKPNAGTLFKIILPMTAQEAYTKPPHA